MALTRANVEAVELRPTPLERYREVLDENEWNAFRDAMGGFAARLRGRVVWNVNSTARGGGVAELLAALIPNDLDAGVDERWLVIQGSPEFFDVTKKIHTLLHGVTPPAGPVTREDLRVYEATLAPNAVSLLELLKEGDVAVLHDPQTAGLVPALARAGVRVIWRSHIGVDKPNDVVREAWRVLIPYLAAADAFIFSRQAYAWDGLEPSRVRIIPPCIDPFTTKNRDMSDAEVTRILTASGLLDGVTASARTVLQVSRWDRLKDPFGVLGGFVRHIAPVCDAWLVLAGPQVDGVDDDPEQPEILRQLVREREGLEAGVRKRVVIAPIPMRDIEQNAAIVNAMQRHATVVVQKSLAEGFGLTVAEAMWKARPVVASRVGGIEDQIVDGRSGILVDDPADLGAFGAAVVTLFRDPAEAEELGRRARQRIIQEFLAPRHLLRQADLITSLL